MKIFCEENIGKEVLSNIFSCPKNKHIFSYPSAIVDRTKTKRWKIVEDNQRYDIGLKDLPKITYRSLSTLKREFQEYYGVPLGKWITERRLK